VGVFGGPKVESDGLVFSFDPGNTKSSLRKKQSSNILPDPNNWTTGTGGVSGYGANGSSSEQNRLYVSDDPWGRRSVTWRTTPDATSGADGGWNTSSYSIDRAYTYRWSVWVRRYTEGTGGTFYFGLNPAPIRNDTGAVQSNPYFTYPAISNLTYNQWYLVVGHCFYEGYSGGRHPDSGWYENGVKISDKSYGNVGAQDVRWNSGTTSALHRAYHYYTTNTASGIEFAYPRLDKCDGTEPTIKELIEVGESGGKGLISGKKLDLYNGVDFGEEGRNVGYFSFDGTDDYITLPNFTYTPYCLDFWVYNNTQITANNGAVGGPSTYQTLFRNLSGLQLSLGGWTSLMTYETLHILSGGKYTYINETIPSGLHNWVYNWNGSNFDIWVDGIKKTAIAGTTGHATLAEQSLSNYLGYNAGSYYFYGKIYGMKIYTSQLSDDKVLQNFNALRGRFGI